MYMDSVDPLKEFREKFHYPKRKTLPIDKTGMLIVHVYIKLEVRLETIENVESIKWIKSRDS